MTDPIARPGFYEGEVLPAADLTATVDYAREQMARHARYAHSWGIVTGLELKSSTTATAGGQSYAVITVSPGVAIDGTGREIVVPDAVPLDPTDFLSQVFPQPDKTILYPVFLVGLDQAAPASSGLAGACNSSQSTRTQESYNIFYGAPGSELKLSEQALPGLTDGVDDGVTQSWKILLGYVTWDVTSTQTQFTGSVDVNNDNNVGRQYVGVNAARVVSGSGALLLATHPATATDKNAIMAVKIEEAPNDGQLLFGKLNADGSIVPVLTVKSTGDVIATGQISGAVTPGSVQVQSGIAFDGMTLPLPLGIDAADVAAGKVTLHIHVSLRMDQLQPPAAVADWEPFPFECRVDLATRQLHSRLKWRDMTNPPHPSQILPAFSDYTVIAAVAAS
jgi:hypothetical protein